MRQTSGDIIYYRCLQDTSNSDPFSSIGIKLGQGYPDWECFCSLFGRTGNLTRKGEARDRLSVSFISGVRTLPQQTQSPCWRGCRRADMFRVRGRSQWSRCHQDERHAPGLSEARGGLGTAQPGQSPCQNRLSVARSIQLRRVTLLLPSNILASDPLAIGATLLCRLPMTIHLQPYSECVLVKSRYVVPPLLSESPKS
jgi:hypothetical protein